MFKHGNLKSAAANFMLMTSSFNEDLRRNELHLVGDFFFTFSYGNVTREEYGYPIYCCASDTHLQRLERVQFSDVRIITGLRNSSPKDIVLYEENLQPLSLRSIPNLVKYYNKLYSLDSRIRNSAYLKECCNNQRLKRNSRFSQVISCNLITKTVEQCHLTQSIDPSVGLPGVFFHTNLPVQVNKQKNHPTYLKQLALKIINDIPVDAVKMYTDGSRNDSDCTGRGIYIKTHNQELKIQRRNPDVCSVFSSELIAIDEGLDSLSSFSCSNEIWILTDSRSSIQHLANWHRVRDNTGMNILNKLKSLSVSYRINLQWIPSHLNIRGNEIADAFAKAGADYASVSSAPLNYLEMFSRAKGRNKTFWLIPPVHH
ncbi:hypothetical protein AVEN_99099-1 [Araneus ventricosus]|uniref:RNase H type-1 domain-containing protein n=1 Tax=Araneus ventricosus TaxID=182803 RepID=A0A4Y2K5R8_ARAVE|nr:hypothetical protein AVEN_99099-1 [Araneus ventricosus]